MAYKSDCLVEEGPESESLLFNFEGPKGLHESHKMCSSLQIARRFGEADERK